MAGWKGMEIGVALGKGEVVGVVLGRMGAPTARVALSPGDEGSQDGGGLGPAIRELKAMLERASGGPTDGAGVHTTLLPPLAEARLVSFPPMRKVEIEAVLGRDVLRYFLGPNGPRVVGVRVPKGKGKGTGQNVDSSVTVLASATPLGYLEMAKSAIEDVGWRAVSFSAAHGAWLAAATADKGSEVAAVVAVVGGTAHVVRIQGTDPVAVRQLPAGDADAIREAAGPGPGNVMVLGSPGVFEDLRGPLAGAGLTAARGPWGWSTAEECTAAWAWATELELVPPTLARKRDERVRKASLRLAGGALALILASLGAQFWGVHRELDMVRERRVAIQDEVAPLLLARDSLNGLVDQVESLDALSRESPVWTRSLVELAALLPEDTYLTGFFASGDTVELEAAGTKAGEAIQALREAGLFEEVRLQGLVERELEDGETVIERFRLWARLPGEGGGS